MTDTADTTSQDVIDRAMNGAEGARSSTVDDIARKLHEAVDRLAGHANNAEHRISAATDDLDALMSKSRRAASAKADELSGTVGDYINQHPIAALGIAFGAGLLVAALLRRNS